MVIVHEQAVVLLIKRLKDQLEMLEAVHYVNEADQADHAAELGQIGGLIKYWEEYAKSRGIELDKTGEVTVVKKGHPLDADQVTTLVPFYDAVIRAGKLYDEVVVSSDAFDESAHAILQSYVEVMLGVELTYDETSELSNDLFEIIVGDVE